MPQVLLVYVVWFVGILGFYLFPGPGVTNTTLGEWRGVAGICWGGPGLESFFVTTYRHLFTHTEYYSIYIRIKRAQLVMDFG